MQTRSKLLILFAVVPVLMVATNVLHNVFAQVAHNVAAEVLKALR